MPALASDLNPFARKAPPRGLLRWLPGLRLWRTYQPSWLAKDVVAGLVLTAVLVPVGMGYAEAAGLPALLFGDPVVLNGRTLLAVDGLEESLDDPARKRRVWQHFQSLRP